MSECPPCKFTNNLSLEERKKECEKIKAKHPDRIPTIIVRHRGSKFAELESSKFLIPKDLTVGHFIYVLRTKIKLRPEQAIFVFVNGILPPNTALVSQIHEKHQSEDGFLYLTITSENTFGA
jgi:GABA(A) receptor-associated protein